MLCQCHRKNTGFFCDDGEKQVLRPKISGCHRKIGLFFCDDEMKIRQDAE